MRLLVFAGLIFSLAATSAMSDEIPGSAFSSGNWTGAAYTFNGTEKFSHCAISASYASGNTLLFTVNHNATVSVAVYNPSFRLSVGERFPVSLYVDQLPPFYGNATALTTTMAGLTFGDFRYAMSAFQRGYILRIVAPGSTSEYSLRGSYAALDLARQCAYHFVTMAANAPASPPPRTAAAPSSMDKTVLFQVATEMISELGVKDFKYLTAAEMKTDGLPEGVFWTAKSEGLTAGTLTAALPANQSLKETDPSDIAFLAKMCPGDVATSSSGVSIKGVDARELRSMCVVGDKKSETRVTKVHVGGTVLYTLITFSANSPQVSQAAREKAAVDVATKAASYILPGN